MYLLCILFPWHAMSIGNGCLPLLHCCSSTTLGFTQLIVLKRGDGEIGVPSGTIEKTNLVLVHNPALKLVIPAIVALALLDHLVNGQMAQSRTLGQQLSVRRLAHARRARDDDIRR